jgi:hypothetical protein
MNAGLPGTRTGLDDGSAVDPSQPPADHAGGGDEQIIALALEHPAHGCNPFEALLMIDGQRFQGGASTDPIQRKRVDRATSAHATKATSCSIISW